MGDSNEGRSDKKSTQKKQNADSTIGALEFTLAASLFNEHAAALARIGDMARFVYTPDYSWLLDTLKQTRETQRIMEQALEVPLMIRRLLEEQETFARTVLDFTKRMDWMIATFRELGRYAELPKSLVPTVSPVTFRLGTAIQDLERARVSKLENRVLALEAAVKQLQDLLKDPDISEDMKEEIKKRLKDLPPLDYIQ